MDPLKFQKTITNIEKNHHISLIFTFYYVASWFSSRASYIWVYSPGLTSSGECLIKLYTAFHSTDTTTCKPDIANNSVLLF